MTAAGARAQLLAHCDAAFAKAAARTGFGSREVREGIAAGRFAIESVALDGDARTWLTSVLAALEAKRATLDDPTDDDGWALGGLATVRREVERLLEALT